MRLSARSHRRQTVEDVAFFERLPSVYHALASVATIWLTLLAVIFQGAAASHPAAASEPSAVLSGEQLKADWIQENALRGVPVPPSGEITSQEDAACGCDGVIDGKWGFHTNLEDDPWWQLDLKRPMSLDQIHIYNRCDHTAGRAARLSLLLS